MKTKEKIVKLVEMGLSPTTVVKLNETQIDVLLQKLAISTSFYSQRRLLDLFIVREVLCLKFIKLIVHYLQNYTIYVTL